MKLEKNTLYSNSQIAEWFGLKSRKFTNKGQKEKKLEQLKLFADYELVGDKTKKIFIKEVYEPVYSKKGSQNFQIINNNLEKYWKDNGRGLDICKRVGEAMFKDGITTLSCSSAVNYAGISKREKYGVNYMSEGKIGYSIYAWGKWVQGEGQEEPHLEPLTAQEQAIKNQLIKKYFGNTTEKQIFIQNMIDNGEIRKQDAWGLLEELTNMKGKMAAFKADFAIAIDSAIGRGTYLIPRIDEESAF